MIAFYCTLKSRVHLRTREFSDSKLDALCGNGSKINRNVETAIQRLSSLIRWDITSLLRFLCAELFLRYLFTSL